MKAFSTVLLPTLCYSLLKQDLTANWKFREYFNEDKPWLKAQVPSTVHMDLLRLGIIKDPYIRTQNTEVLWVAETDWQYSLQFDVDKDMLD